MLPAVAPLETIVVGFDDSEPARRALFRAADLAEAFDAALVVTSVQRLPESSEPVDRAEFLQIALGGEETGELATEAGLPELEAAEALLEGRRVRPTLVPGAGDAADAIVDVAEKHDADLIVVGTGAPNMLERLLGMSVSDAVTRHFDREVLIVP